MRESHIITYFASLTSCGVGGEIGENRVCAEEDSREGIDGVGVEEQGGEAGETHPNRRQSPFGQPTRFHQTFGFPCLGQTGQKKEIPSKGKFQTWNLTYGVQIVNNCDLKRYFKVGRGFL